MMIKSDISTRIQVLRFPLILFVVFIHGSWFIPYQSHSALISSFPQLFVSNTLARIAVPLLFIISGYLYFIKFDFSWKTYKEKLNRRFFSLILPYLIWNVSYSLFLLFKQYTTENPSQNDPFIINIHNFGDFINAIIGPDLGPFWYVRDLIVLIIIAPLFWILAKKAPYLCLLILGVPWLIYDKVGRVSSLFFLIGCLIAIKQWDVTKFDRYKIFLLPIYLVLAGVIACFQGIYQMEQFWMIPLRNITILLGIIVMWSITDVVTPQIKAYLLYLSRFAFFVYASHSPIFMLQNQFFPGEYYLQFNPLMQSYYILDG
jgi:surface polysaccharide O-acyltransferase-like enzyme